MTKIIICDSGVSKDQLPYVQAYDIGAGIIDENGHGSQLSRLIKMTAPKSEIISIKILDKNKECSLETLLHALRYCESLDANIVCLALSVDQEIHSVKLKESIDNLYNKNIIVISALHNNMVSSLPASFSNVIGVKMNETYQKIGQSYNKQSEIQCTLFIDRIICKTFENQYSLMGGNSLACGLFSAQVSNTISQHKIKSFFMLQEYFENLEHKQLGVMSFFGSQQLSHKNQLYFNIKEKVDYINKSLNMGKTESPIYSEIYGLGHLSNYITYLGNENLIINKKTFFRLCHLQNSDTLTDYFMEQEEIQV